MYPLRGSEPASVKSIKVCDNGSSQLALTCNEGPGSMPLPVVLASESLMKESERYAALDLGESAVVYWLRLEADSREEEGSRELPASCELNSCTQLCPVVDAEGG